LSKRKTNGRPTCLALQLPAPANAHPRNSKSDALAISRPLCGGTADLVLNNLVTHSFERPNIGLVQISRAARENSPGPPKGATGAEARFVCWSPRCRFNTGRNNGGGNEDTNASVSLATNMVILMPSSFDYLPKILSLLLLVTKWAISRTPAGPGIARKPVNRVFQRGPQGRINRTRTRQGDSPDTPNRSINYFSALIRTLQRP
jgi:hypothetical protein